ncbi:MAG TPA: Rieske 2Fe-2S domain-containing protein [Chloroflexota bacterium]|nr:Rieske 2Fe-2S domain-containing protein [Chloroflexota bacterium]
MAHYIVARAGEIPPGGRKVVEVAGVEICVFNIGGEYFAFRNRCPHQGGPLCIGTLWGFVVSDGPGDARLVREGEVLKCPWHAWEYDIRTGQSWYQSAKPRARRYPVQVAPGRSLLGAREDQLADAGYVKGPFVAETYPVSLDEEYVVVEVP